jgi:hypothetical protein
MGRPLIDQVGTVGQRSTAAALRGGVLDSHAPIS